MRTSAHRLSRYRCRADAIARGPSVLHVPWVTLKFLFTTVVFGGSKMTRARWNNVLAPILLPFVGFPVGPAAYYIISATRV